MSDGATEPGADVKTTWRSWYALGVLAAVTLFAFVDRQVLQLTAEQIKASLRLSDFQLGLLQGTSVALFTALAIYPLAWLADRYDRRIVLAGSILAWSVAVAFCAYARTFEELFIATAMVGAGEAGLAPLTFAAIPDLFSKKNRQLANSVFAIVATTSGALAMIVGGQLVSSADAARPFLPEAFGPLEGWRLAFLLVALPAPLMVALVFTVPLNRRRLSVSAEGIPAQGPPTSSGEMAPFLKRNAAAMGTLFGAIGLSNFGTSALLSWIIVICMRQFGQTPAQVGAAVGIINLIAVAIGFTASVWLSRTLAPRIGPIFPLRALWISYVCIAVTLAGMAFAPNAMAIYTLLGIGYVINGTAGMMIPTAIQGLAPPAVRARFLAVNAMVSLAMAACAAPLVGLLSDRLSSQLPNALLLSALCISVPSLLLGGALLRSGERRFEALMAETEPDPVTGSARQST